MYSEQVWFGAIRGRMRPLEAGSTRDWWHIEAVTQRKCKHNLTRLQLEIIMEKSFSPAKTQFYAANGAGRDSYIYGSNGGFCP